MLSLIRKLRKSQSAAASRGRTARRTGSFRPGLEALETRLVPSSNPWNYYTWTGAGGDGKWSNDANWQSQDGDHPVNGIGAVLIFDYGQVSKVNGVYQTASTDNLSGGITLTALTIQGTARSGEPSFQIGGNQLSFDGNGITDSANGPSSAPNGADVVSAPILLLGNLPVTVSGKDTLTLSGQITQGGPSLGLTKEGGGTLILASSTSNTARGTTTVQAGALELQGPAGVQQVTFSLVIDPLAAVLDNVNGQLGFVDVTVEPLGILGLAPNVSDSVHSLSGSASTGSVTSGLPSIVNLGAGSLLTINGGTGSTFAGNIAGGGGLTVAGSYQVLSGTNTYTGPTAVTGFGTLVLGSANAIKSSSGITVADGASLGLQGGFTFAAVPLTLGGDGSGDGALDSISGLNTWQGAITLADDTTIRVGTSLNLTGAIGGSGGLTQTAYGTLTLSGTGTYTGATTVTTGVLSLANALALDLTSGTTVDDGATLQLAGAGAIYFSQPLTLNGPGFNSEGALFNAKGGNVWENSITLAETASIGVAGSTSLTLPGAISGAGGLTEVGGGTLVLKSSGNTYAGRTLVTTGTLKLQGTGIQVPGKLVIGTESGSPGSAVVQDNANEQLLGASVVIHSGGKLSLAGISEQIAALTGTGSVVLSSTANLEVNVRDSAEYDGAFSGSGGLVLQNFTSGATWTLGGASPHYNGEIQVEAGTQSATLAVKNAAALGTGAVWVVNGSALELEGGITVSSPSELLLNPGSVLEGSGGNSTWAAPVSLLTLSGGVTLNGPADIDAATGTTLTISGAVSENRENPAGSAAGLKTTGGGTVALSGSNSYTGGTEVAAGVLRAVGGAALGSHGGGVTVDGGAALALTGGITYDTQALTLSGAGLVGGGALVLGSGISTWNGAITLAADATVAAGPGDTLTLPGTISGSHTLTATGGGTVTLTGQDNAATTAVSDAILVVNGHAGAVTVGDLGVLEGTGTTGAVTVNSGGTVKPGSATAHTGVLTTGAATFAQGSAYAVQLSASGAGQLTAQGNVDLTGATLKVTRAAGYTPKSGTEFVIVSTGSADSITGTFASVPSGYTVTYDTTSVILKVK